MKNVGIFALFGALATAAPLNKRDVVWVTETAVDVVTVPVTKTVWMEPGSTETVSAKEDYRHRATHTVTATATVSSATSVASSSSVYVAPTTEATTESAAPATSSTSVYVAPTTSTTSSVYVAPTTSTSSSVYVAPTTTTAAPTTSDVATSTSASPSSTSSSSSTSGLPDTSSGAEYNGQITNNTPGLGSCGWTNSDTEDIVAVSYTIMDKYNGGNPNTNPLCGRYITITGSDGSAYTAKVVDTCPGCQGEAGSDLPSPLYNKVTNSDTNAPLTLDWAWN